MAKRKKGGVYIWRARKPGSLLGIPFSWCVIGAAFACASLYAMHAFWPFGIVVLLFSGTHFAYVGETVSFYHRERQHRGNRGTADVYQQAGKPWIDLNAKIVCRVPLPTNATWRWTKRLQKVWLRSVETFIMFATWPVYNDAKNRWNPRRIPQNTALRQRAARDGRAIRWSLNFRAHHVLMIFCIAVISLRIVGVF